MTAAVTQRYIQGIKKLWKTVFEYILKNYRRALIYLLFFSFVGYCLYSFKIEPQAISYEGVFQRGSMVNWIIALKRLKGAIILPQWINPTVNVTGENIYLRSCNSKDDLSLAFATIPDTIKDWGISQSSQPHIMPSFKAQDAHFSSSSTMNLTLWSFLISGAVEFHGEPESVSSISLRVRHPYSSLAAQLRGRVSEHFQLFLDSDGGSRWSRQFEARFGEFPSRVFLTDPPTYPKEVGMVGISLQGGEFDVYMGGCDKDDSFFISATRNLQNFDLPTGVSLNLNLPIKSAALEGFRNSVVTLAGQIHSIAPSDQVEITFDESSPGQLLVDIKPNGPSIIAINGIAKLVSQNGVSLLPNSIESWPWYKQAIVWASIGFLFSLIFEKPLAHFRKLLQGQKS